MFIDWQRIRRDNDETDPTIDQFTKQAAHALKNGVTLEQIQAALVEDRGLDPGKAALIARAAQLLKDVL